MSADPKGLGTRTADPTFLFYDRALMYDAIHLNARGAAKFTAQLAKDVKAVLGE